MCFVILTVIFMRVCRSKMSGVFRCAKVRPKVSKSRREELKITCCIGTSHSYLIRYKQFRPKTPGKISHEIIKSFSGKGDVVTWLRKVGFVAKLQNIADLTCLIPLYVEDDALALYLEMNERKQTGVKRMEDRLEEAFTGGVFVSYNKLSIIRWAGQTVDVYANEIRKLAGLSGFAEEGLETAVKMAFVNGFPEDVSVALQQIPNVMGTDMNELISKGRVLTANRATGFGAVVVKEKVGEE